MAKWMDVTIFGLNVVITWQPKISHQIGTEFSEQQLNRIGVDLNGKVSQLRKRIARLQREIAYCGIEGSYRKESRGRKQVQSSVALGRGETEPRLSPEATETPRDDHEMMKAKLKGLK